VRHITEVSNWFQKEGHEVFVRGLDREALARLAGERKTVYDLDQEFKDFFEIGA